MVGLYLCVMLLLVEDPPVEVVGGQVAEQVTPAKSDPRPMHEIHRDLRIALQEEASTEDAARRAASVARLALIYGEIMRDPRLPDSPTLGGYRVKTRARLLSVQKDLQRDMARQGLAPARASASLGAEPWSMSFGLEGESADQLAARLKAAAARWGSGQGGAALSDYGPLLVELIQQTISPEFWDVHGGPGVIIYYRPGRALVIRATEDIHRQIGGAVSGLRQ